MKLDIRLWKLFAGALALVFAGLACGTTVRPAGREADPIWVKAGPPGFGNFAYYSPAYEDGLFFALDDAGMLFAWDELTGETDWQTEAAAFRFSEDRAALFVAKPDGACVRLNPLDGGMLEMLAVARGYLCEPFRKNDAEAAYTLADDGTLTATSLETGETLWRQPINLPEAISSSSIFIQPAGWQDEILVRGGRVLVHTASYAAGDEYTEYFNFQVFEAATGLPVWEVVGKAHGAVIYDGERVYLVYAGTHGGTDSNGRITAPLKIHAHDVASGDELWQADWAGLDFYTLSGGVLSGCVAGEWLALEAATGQVAGNYKFPVDGNTSLCPLMNNPGSDRLVRGVVFHQAGRASEGYEFEFVDRPQDTWIDIFDLMTGKALWSTEIVIEDTVSLAAVGSDVILIWWQGDLRAYAINGK